MHSLSKRESTTVNTPSLRTNNQVPLLTYHLFEPYSNEVSNFVSTRLGGVSEAPFNELNLSLSSSDKRENVLENRQRLAKAARIDLEQLNVAQLIQGTHLAIITPELQALPVPERLAALSGTDGLLTNIPNAPLGILVADCTAVSFFDPVEKVIAISHAGWRGTAGNIVGKTIAMMQTHFGCDPTSILVGLSPNMSGDTFQVRDDVLQVFQANFGPAIDRFFRLQEDSTYRLDLNDLLVWQLETSGIQAEHIESAGFDTYERTDLFFSHRAEHGKTGRFCGLIVLR